MANITIPNLPSATAATDLDILVIVDSGETTTSKITKADLLSGIGGGELLPAATGSYTTALLGGVANTNANYSVNLGFSGVIDSGSDRSALLGGTTNEINGASGDDSVIIGGSNNIVSANGSSITAGNTNNIGANIFSSGIISSSNSLISGFFKSNNTIIGGSGVDITNGNRNLISNSSNSTISSSNSNNTIIGSATSDITGNGSYSVIIGSFESNILSPARTSLLSRGYTTNIRGGDSVIVLGDKSSNFDSNGSGGGIANYTDSIFAASNEDIDIRINGGVGSSGSTFAIGSVRSWIGATSTTRGNIRGSGMINAVDSHIQNTGATYTKNNYIIGGTNVAIEENTKVMTLNVDNYTATTDNIVVVPQLVMTEYSSLNFSGDTAAAAGGVVLGGVYHDNGALRVRIS